MAFRYEPYRSDLTGTIADVIGRGAAAQAQAVRDIAAGNARAQELRGQTTAHMLGSIGDIATGAIDRYRQEQLDAPRREMQALQVKDAQRHDADAQRTQAEDAWLRGRLSDGTKPPPDVHELAEHLGPERAVAIHRGFAQITDDDLQNEARTLDLFGRDIRAVEAMPVTMRQQMWGAVRQRWAGHGVPAEMIPEQYAPEVAAGLLQRTQKAPEPFTLTPGQVRYDANGKVIATAASRPVAVAPGSSLVNPDNPQAGPVYTAPKPEVPVSLQPKSVLLDGKPAEVVFNPHTGKYLDLSGADVSARVKPVPPASVTIRNMTDAPPPGNFDLTGDAFLETVPKEWRMTVKKIASYEEDPTKSVAMRSGMRDKITQWVNQYNPAYKSDEFAVRAPTRKAFTTGTQGQQINAINTAIGHIDQITGLADQLQNGGFVPGNAAWNSLRTMFGSDKVTNFDTLKDALAGEVASVLAKGGATVSGIAEAKQKIFGANSPAQLAGYVKTLIPVMGSKLAALDYQYHQAMGPDDTFSALSKDAKTILAKHGFDPGHPMIAGGPPPTSGGLISVTDPNGKAHTFKSQADADAFKKAAGIQ